MPMGPCIRLSRIYRKVKLIPGLRLGVRAFTNLKWMTGDFLLLWPNNKAKKFLGKHVW